MHQKRRELLRNGLLGVALTAVTMALQAGGALGRLDNWFYDQRCRYCQPSNQPTDRLEHVDIDDESIAAIGRWPWPRQDLAAIIEAIHDAGAKAIALDILLADPEKTSGGEPDREMAEVLRNAQDIVLPVAFTFGSSGISERQSQLVKILWDDMETSRERLNEMLAARKIAPATSDEYVNALHATAATKMKSAGYPVIPAQQIKRLLLPRQEQIIARTMASRVLDEELMRAEALRSIRRFGRPPEPGIISPLLCNDEIPPLKQFADAAAGCGFVDFLVGADGVTRRVPLWVQDKDRLFPQFGLALACAYLHVSPDQIRIERNRVIVPRPQGTLTIPVVSQHTSDQSMASLFMDVPFFGTSDWQTSYDFPVHQQARQHVNVTVAWEVVQTRNRIHQNNRELDEAIEKLMSMTSPEKVEAYRKNPPSLDDFESRESRIKSLLADSFVRRGIEELDNETPEEQQHRDLGAQRFAASAAAALSLPAENRRLAVQLAELKKTLRREVEGKAVIIGSAATGAHDFRTTPLHVQCPGSVVHGMVFNAILTGHVWRRIPLGLNLAVTMLVGLLVTAGVVWLPPWLGFVAAIAVVASYLGFNGQVLFGRMELIVDAAGPALAGAGVWAGLTLVRLAFVSAERTQIVRRFRYYVDPALVDYVIEHPNRIRLDGEVSDLTVVVTDLDGFGAIADQLRERTVELLNAYMNVMVPLIRARGGYVNKFLGGGIMFFFGAPRANEKHAATAVETVLEMQRATAAFNARKGRRGMPALHMRAGISSGQMVVGDAGADTGSDYTVLGEPVGLCFQFEKANKLFGTRALFGEATLKYVGEQYLVRPIGKIVVPGGQEPLMVYEPMGPADRVSVEQRRLAELTGNMVGSYNAGRTDECLQTVDRLEEEFGQSPLTVTYTRLCHGELTELVPDAIQRIRLSTVDGQMV